MKRKIPSKNSSETSDRKMNTHLLSLHFSLFFKSVLARPDQLYSSLNAHLLNLFDAVPTILPIPEGAPPEVPVVMLKSGRGDYSCNISRIRIDLVSQRIDESKSNSEIFSDFNVKVRAFSSHVIGEQSVKRFGLVARYFKVIDDSPARLKDKYFSSEIKKVSELGLRYNETSSIGDFSINDVVEISAGVEVAMQGKGYKGILVQRDINNVPTSKTIELAELEELSSKLASRVSEEKILELLP